MIYCSLLYLLYIILGITGSRTNRQQKVNYVDEEEDPNIKRVKEKRFYLNEQKVNWFKANELCHLDGKRLATISNEQENNRLKAFLKKKGSPIDVWLSGSDLATTGSYAWLSTGQPFTFTDWKKDSKSTYHCVEMYKFDDKESGRYCWVKYICDYEYFYVCESY